MERYSETEIRSHDMPHEHVMDDKGIEFTDLSASIQRDIREFDDIFQEALKDGYIDETEEKELIVFSYKIAERIRSEHFNESPKNGGGILGVFAGIGIALGTIFGINQIKQS